MLQPQRILQNRYLIKKQIGAGGMGAVYLALDQQTESIVAVKETISADARLGRAFEREARLLSTLRHSALPRVMNYFTEDDGQYIVMEYIEGNDLSEIINRVAPYPIADVLRWADELLDALDYLHNQKTPVVHRDIKPHNLKLNAAGKIILLDFGLAKGVPTDLSRMTATKSIFGYSRSYAPLEQIQGKGTDPRSDLYALAATLYHLMTAEPPLDALTRATAILSGEEDLLRSAKSINPQISTEIALILHQALALNPAIRPESAVAMRFALRAAMEEAEEQTMPVQQTAAAFAPPHSAVALPPKSFQTQTVKNDFGITTPGDNVVLEAEKSPENINIFAKLSAASFFTVPMRIAIALVFVCLLGMSLTIFRGEPIKAVDGGIAPQSKSNAITSETLTPIVESQTVIAPTINTAIEETEVRETDAPTVVKESADEVKKPVSEVAPVSRRRPSPVVAEPEETKVAPAQPRQSAPVAPAPPAKRETETKRKDKDGGFKGLINKIGDGAKKLPNIFKKKKDKKDND